MLKGKKLKKAVQAIVCLLNRKETYEAVIAEKNLQLNSLGIPHKEPMPKYPSLRYSFSGKRFVLRSVIIGVVYYIIMAIPSILTEKSYPFISDTLGAIFLPTFPFIGWVISGITEFKAYKSAKTAANLSHLHALEIVKRQHEEDDMRVKRELETAAQIKEELHGWQEAYAELCDVIDKVCGSLELSEEYLTIDVLTVFAEYLNDGRCATIYECMMKYDETMRMQRIEEDIQGLHAEIETFEESFKEAARKAQYLVKERSEQVRKLCQANQQAVNQISYHQETEKEELFLLSMLK